MRRLPPSSALSSQQALRLLSQITRVDLPNNFPAMESDHWDALDDNLPLHGRSWRDVNFIPVATQARLWLFQGKLDLIRRALGTDAAGRIIAPALVLDDSQSAGATGLTMLLPLSDLQHMHAYGIGFIGHPGQGDGDGLIGISLREAYLHHAKTRQS